MSRQLEMELWFYEDEFRALTSVLEAQGSSVEKQLRKRFDELYEALVPLETRQAIQQQADAERAAQAAEAEAARVFSAFHVREHGREEYFQLEQRVELLDATRYLRRYLRQEPGAEKDSFPELFPRREQITAERFDQLVGLRMENNGKATGAFELDFDRWEFSVVHATDGWRSFSMDDVSTAAYHAFRKEWLPVEDRWKRLTEKLDGKEIASAGHLSAREISLAEEICEMDGHRLNFYLESSFDVDAVFGTRFSVDENDCWVNLYANYDMDSGQVCDSLEVVFHHGDGSVEELDYSLNAAEKVVLLRKMEDYCQQQTGQALAEYSAQRMAEDMTPCAAPEMSV